MVQDTISEQIVEKIRDNATGLLEENIDMDDFKHRIGWLLRKLDDYTDIV
jgi:hypothetical protein